ncbi:MAG: RNA polymerase sigma-70 factor [Cyclobacteriaceae bacterium]|nr:RNA polymerase sigma-70 factor [Cyclobacteriaceae bacterium]
MADGRTHRFEQLFREWFVPLCRFAFRFVPDGDEAKGIVHDVFVSLWEKMEQLPPDTHFRSYLYTAVRNRCLNHLRNQRKVVRLEAAEAQAPQTEEVPLETQELEREIEFAIQTLPEKCREVFELNRKEGLTYAQIAEQLGIAVKTVEAQMSKALAVMRIHLKNYLTLLFFWWL